MDAETEKPVTKVAGFMSGSGSNLRRLLEFQNPAYKVEFLFSDCVDSHIETLALDYNLPYFVYDIRRFYATLGKPRSIASSDGWRLRQHYDQVAARLVKAFAIDIIALGGYMSFLTLPQGGINVHPGDLSIKDEHGKRLLVGARAVEDAILKGCREIRSSTIWIDSGVDSGPLLLLSDPLEVRLPAPLAEIRENESALALTVERYQEELKQKGDWIIFPLTIQLMAQKRLVIKNNIAWLDGRPYPDGITLDKIT